MGRLKWLLLAGALALVVAAIAAGPALAKGGGNSANAKLCQNGGWQSLFTATGGTFADQGECVSYAAQGGTIVTEPPNAWRAACEANGGTFSQVPFGASGVEYICTPVSHDVFSASLNVICVGYPDFLQSGWALGPPPNAICDRGPRS
jgi:hypothetical protein